MSLEGPTGSTLQRNPAALDFGDVAEGQSASLVLTLSAVGDTDVIVSAITSSNPRFALVSPAVPFTVVPGSPVLVTISFSPTAVGAQSGTLTITSDAINNPVTASLTGNGVAAGTKAISIAPSSWNFGSQKAGVASAEKLFTITNTGTVAVSITGITFNGPFSAGATFPGAFPVAVAPAGTLVFGVKFTPVTDIYYTQSNGCVVASDAVSNPDNLALSGTGYLILPAFIVTGADEALLLAFGNTVKRMDPADLNCEENASFERIHNFQLNDLEKALLRIGFTYEDLGVATLKVSATVKRAQDVAGVLTQQPQTVGPVAVRLGTSVADEWPQIAMADLQIREELIQIKVLREANAGKVSLIDYTPKFEPMGEVTEEK